MEKIEVPIVIVYIFSSILFALLLLTVLAGTRWIAREIRKAQGKVEAMSKPPYQARRESVMQNAVTHMSEKQYAEYLQALENQANDEALEANRSYPWQD